MTWKLIEVRASKGQLRSALQSAAEGSDKRNVKCLLSFDDVNVSIDFIKSCLAQPSGR